MASVYVIGLQTKYDCSTLKRYCRVLQYRDDQFTGWQKSNIECLSRLGERGFIHHHLLEAIPKTANVPEVGPKPSLVAPVCFIRTALNSLYAWIHGRQLKKLLDRIGLRISKWPRDNFEVLQQVRLRKAA